MPVYRLRCTWTASAGRRTPVIETRAFEATTDWDALRIGRRLSGLSEGDRPESALIIDERGRIVWPDLHTALER